MALVDILVKQIKHFRKGRSLTLTTFPVKSAIFLTTILTYKMRRLFLPEC